MKKEVQKTINYTIYDSFEELTQINQTLFEKAKDIAEKAHAPYSNFHVGASVLLSNQEIFSGNNQENASYPVGICAERTLLSYVHANSPKEKIVTIAIFSPNTKDMLTPCGLCRQTLIEYEVKQKQKIEILLTNQTQVFRFESASDLLPFQFDTSSF